MTNREYYKEKILDIACNGAAIAVDRETEEVAICGYIYGEGSITCDQCLFDLGDREECEEKCKDWCNQEHIEKPKLTKNEKLFLSILNERWKYAAKDEDGAFLVYSVKPIKRIDIGMWETGTNDMADIDTLLLVNCKFPMVKWEDKEPWLIEDLKKLSLKEKEN